MTRIEDSHNQSEKLCRLLGIYNYKHICPKCGNEFNEFYTDKLHCQWCGCYSWNSDGTNKNMVKVYPDLIKPSNFVKLVSIVYRERSFINIHRVGENNFEDDLIITLQFMGDTDFINKLKLQAQQTNWEY